MKKYSFILPFLFIFVISEIANAQYSESYWKERDEWMQVDKLFELANLRKGLIVADIGSHEGYLTMHLANKVGATGKVHAVDIRRDRLKRLKENAKERKLTNITTVLGNDDNPKLSKNSMDVIFLVDTYHEMSEYKKVLKHIYQALRSKGKLLVLEKLKKHKRGKTRSEQTEAHTIASKFVKKELEEAGFIIRKEELSFGFWENDPTKQIWVLIAEK